MRRSSHHKKAVSWFVTIATIGTVFCALACNSGQASKAQEGKQVPVTAQNSPGPDIDLNCVMDHIQNPPESFQYSFKDESSNPWKEDADVTPQQIDGSFMNNSLTQPQQFHGPPQEVASNLRAIGRLASAFAIVHGTSAVVREGAEKVNGYDTTRFSIDTARGDTSEQGLYTSVLGKGGFEKGTVWVITQGCPVRLVLNEELHNRDGSLSGAAHYEEAMVRK